MGCIVIPGLIPGLRYGACVAVPDPELDIGTVPELEQPRWCLVFVGHSAHGLNRYLVSKPDCMAGIRSPESVLFRRTVPDPEFDAPCLDGELVESRHIALGRLHQLFGQHVRFV